MVKNEDRAIEKIVTQSIECLEQAKDRIYFIQLAITNRGHNSYSTVSEYEKNLELKESMVLYKELIQEMIDDLTEELEKYKRR